MSNLRAFIFVVALLALIPRPSEGQLSLVGGPVHTKALGGQSGADVRIGFDPPLMPVGFFAGADYFFTECSDECGLSGWRAGSILHSGTPALQVYLTGAYLVREYEMKGSEEERVGAALGGGIRFGVGFRIQAEATWEFLGDDLSEWVFRVGLGF